MSVGTALGQDYEAPILAARSPAHDSTPHVGYASSQSSESGLKGRPGSPDSPLLWSGAPSCLLPCCEGAVKRSIICLWLPAACLLRCPRNPKPQGP